VDLRVWSLFALFRKILPDQFSSGDDAEDLYGIEQSFSLFRSKKWQSIRSLSLACLAVGKSSSSPAIRTAGSLGNPAIRPASRGAD